MEADAGAVSSVTAGVASVADFLASLELQEMAASSDPAKNELISVFIAELYHHSPAQASISVGQR